MQLMQYMVSFAVGALLGDAFIHLLPETYLKLGAGIKSAVLVLSGILIFFILEKFIRWRHCHNLECEEKEHVHPAGIMNIFGHGVHSLIDGLLIGASYLASIELGIATSVAILLHEIPQEMGDFSILVHSGYQKKKAILFNFLSAAIIIFGALISLIVGFGTDGFVTYLLPITAGGFLYIAGSDLIPQLHQEVRFSKSIFQFFAIILGIAIMVLLKFIG